MAFPMALVSSLYGGISFTGGYGYVLPNPLVCRDNDPGKSNPFCRVSAVCLPCRAIHLTLALALQHDTRHKPTNPRTEQ